MRELAMALAYEATRDFEVRDAATETPLGMTRQPKLAGEDMVLISILRAGNGLLDGMLDWMPIARVGFVGMYRNEETLTPVEYYFKVPEHLEKRQVIVVDPMLATANSSIAAVQRVKQAGARDLRFLCVLAAPEGIEAFEEAHPDVPIFTACVDSHLNEKGYIVPGLGDAGDRLFGTL